MNKNWLLLTISATLIHFGSAVIWSGLPFYVAKISGNINHLSGLFVAETISALLFGLLAGYLTDSMSRKKICVSSSLGITLTLVICMFTSGRDNIYIFYITGLVVSVFGTLTQNAISVWVSETVPSTELERWSGKRGMLIISAKLFGTSVGPLLFNLFDHYVLYLDAITFFIGAIIYSFASEGGAILPSRKGKHTLKGLCGDLKSSISVAFSNRVLKKYILIDFLLGIVGMPVTSACMIILVGHLGATDKEVSLFWMIGFAGSFFGQFLMGRGIKDYFGAPWLVFLSCIGALTAILGVVYSGALSFFFFFFTLTFTRVIIGSVVFSFFFRAIEPKFRGRILSISDISTEIGSLIGFGFIAIISVENTPMKLFMLSLFPFVLAAILACRVTRTDVLQVEVEKNII
ncbi:MAG: hypothetical protein RL571_1676 [Pseudomonadota bacterium]|jgi:MFS family permease